MLALLLDFALGAIRPRRRLLRRALVAARLVVAALMIPFPVAVAARLITPAIAALLVIALAVAVAARLAIASPAAFAAAVILPVTRFVARTFRTLRSRRSHRRFVGRCRLVGRLLRLEPAEEASEKSRTGRLRGCRCRGGKSGGGT